jgi:hypothetical protein
MTQALYAHMNNNNKKKKQNKLQNQDYNVTVFSYPSLHIQ